MSSRVPTSGSLGAFKIPRKATTTVDKNKAGDSGVHHDHTASGIQFTEVSVVSDIDFRHEVIDQFHKDLLHKSQLFSICKILSGRRIQNKRLHERFVARQKKLRQMCSAGSGDASMHTVSYAYLLLDPEQRNEEEDYLGSQGLFCGYSGLNGLLGSSQHGVYLSLHPDACVPTPLTEGRPMRFLIFKILKGRIKMYAIDKIRQIQAERELRLDKAYNAHMLKRDIDLMNEPSALVRHQYSQIYLYEYDENITNLLEQPSSVLPFASLIVELRCTLKTRCTIPLWHIPEMNVVWSGPLQFGSIAIERVDLVSQSRNPVKPGGFSLMLSVDVIVSMEQCVQWGPIRELLKRPEMIYQTSDACWLLVDSDSYQTPNIVVANTDADAATSSKKSAEKKDVLVEMRYLTLTSLHGAVSITSISPVFRRMHSNMRKGQLVGLSRLSNGSTLLLIPNSELATLLGLPRCEHPTFHCIFVSSDPDIQDLKLVSLDSESYIMPQAKDRLDGADPELHNAFKKFHEERGIKYQQPSEHKQQLAAGSADSAVPSSSSSISTRINPSSSFGNFGFPRNAPPATTKFAPPFINPFSAAACIPPPIFIPPLIVPQSVTFSPSILIPPPPPLTSSTSITPPQPPPVPPPPPPLDMFEIDTRDEKTLPKKKVLEQKGVAVSESSEKADELDDIEKKRKKFQDAMAGKLSFLSPNLTKPHSISESESSVGATSGGSSSTFAGESSSSLSFVFNEEAKQQLLRSIRDPRKKRQLESDPALLQQYMAEEAKRREQSSTLMQQRSSQSHEVPLSTKPEATSVIRKAEEEAQSKIGEKISSHIFDGIESGEAPMDISDQFLQEPEQMVVDANQAPSADPKLAASNAIQTTDEEPPGYFLSTFQPVSCAAPDADELPTHLQKYEDDEKEEEEVPTTADESAMLALIEQIVGGAELQHTASSRGSGSGLSAATSASAAAGEGGEKQQQQPSDEQNNSAFFSSLLKNTSQQMAMPSGFEFDFLNWGGGGANKPQATRSLSHSALQSAPPIPTTPSLIGAHSLMPFASSDPATHREKRCFVTSTPNTTIAAVSVVVGSDPQQSSKNNSSSHQSMPRPSPTDVVAPSPHLSPIQRPSSATPLRQSLLHPTVSDTPLSLMSFAPFDFGSAAGEITATPTHFNSSTMMAVHGSSSSSSSSSSTTPSSVSKRVEIKEEPSPAAALSESSASIVAHFAAANTNNTSARADDLLEDATKTTTNNVDARRASRVEARSDKMSSPPPQPDETDDGSARPQPITPIPLERNATNAAPPPQQWSKMACENSGSRSSTAAGVESSSPPSLDTNNESDNDDEDRDFRAFLTPQGSDEPEQMDTDFRILSGPSTPNLHSNSSSFTPTPPLSLPLPAFAKTALQQISATATSTVNGHFDTPRTTSQSNNPRLSNAAAALRLYNNIDNDGGQQQPAQRQQQQRHPSNAAGVSAPTASRNLFGHVAASSQSAGARPIFHRVDIPPPNIRHPPPLMPASSINIGNNGNGALDVATGIQAPQLLQQQLRFQGTTATNLVSSIPPSLINLLRGQGQNSDQQQQASSTKPNADIPPAGGEGRQ